MKKGFTLVELAIVLVIIGLIMGMAIKGKSLIAVARMRAELHKISKIEAGLAMYAARMGGAGGRSVIPPFASGTTGALDINLLASMGLVSDSDLKSSMISGYTPDPRDGYELHRCVSLRTKESIGGDGTDQGFLEGDGTWQSTYPHARLSSRVCLVGFGMRTDLKCSIETFLDDEDVARGIARAWHSTSGFNKLTEADYRDCISVVGTVNGGVDDYAIEIL